MFRKRWTLLIALLLLGMTVCLGIAADAFDPVVFGSLPVRVLVSNIGVIDTYEHAFYIDYQNRKPDYIEKFMAHIDWNEAGARFKAA